MPVWFVEIVSSCRALLSLFASVLYLRFLLPHNLIPYVHAELNEALLLLDGAELTGAVPLESKERRALACFTNRFMVMRIESHRSPGLLQQLELAVWCGLTYKLYALSLRINAVKADVKLAIDLLQLSSLITAQSVTPTALPARDGPFVAGSAMQSASWCDGDDAQC